MSLALELFWTALGMIFLIVIVAEGVWKVQKIVGKQDDGSDRYLGWAWVPLACSIFCHCITAAKAVVVKRTGHPIFKFTFTRTQLPKRIEPISVAIFLVMFSGRQRYREFTSDCQLVGPF